jgi:isoleucyl-tRNA synthetase
MSRKFTPVEIEETILKFWEDNKLYQKTKEFRKGKKKFYFCDGPPYTTGAIHLGTAWNKIIKDHFLRYRRMRGYDVYDRPGYDMHGLPIEVQIEKKLGIETKKDIEEKFGVERFIEECRNFAIENLNKMTEQFKRLAVWMDWDDPYMTIKDSYIEGAWWALKKAYEKDLLYKGTRVLNSCPRCETVLAKHEYEYKTVGDPSIFVKFQLRDKPNEFFIVWTTTPWTLPSDLAVMVHPEFEYIRAQVEDEVWIIGKFVSVGIISAMLEKKFKVIEEVTGETLRERELRYIHPLIEEVPIMQEFHEKYPEAHAVLLTSEYVTKLQGTGIVHSSPGAGPEDFEVGTRYGLPPFSPLDEAGRFTEEAGKYAGLFVKDADPIIIEDLRRKGLLLATHRVEHEYAHCWRCKSPLIFQATSQWMLNLTKEKEKILAENDKVTWSPKWAGSQSFRSWLENLQDWCISRQRYWGIPLPLWICDVCDSIEVIGSRKELLGMYGKPVDDFHRPWIDEVTWVCACGGTFRRVPDVLDVWLDSGAATWAILPYPENPKPFNYWWPADFILEGKDQVRGWFNSQICLSVVAMDRTPYKSVYMHGFVADTEGRKMSKSLGNAIEPEAVIEKYGSEAFRFYSLATPPGEDMKFDFKTQQDYFKILNILWNTYMFALSRVDESNFDVQDHPLDELELLVEDKWLLSRLQSAIDKMTQAFEEMRPGDTIPIVQELIVEDISRWYIRLIRERTWISESGSSKEAALATLITVLTETAKIFAPILPIIAESVYQDLIREQYPDLPDTIHMCDWPEVDESLRDEQLENAMKDARKIVELTLALRDEHNIKLRWPCKGLLIIPKEGFDDISEVIPSITHEANVKDVVVTETLPSSTEHLVSTTSDSFDLYLDLEITDEIASERLVREFMRQVQFTRKKNRLNVSDRIDLIVVSQEDKIRQYLNEWRDEIIAKVGAQNYETQEDDVEENIKETYSIFSELQYANAFVKIYMKKIPLSSK